MKLKAVIPAAGLGTRFLPLTKGQPKEMLPIVDKPIIQYVIEEAVAAGIDDIVVITGKSKRAIEDHFDHFWELETALNQQGRNGELEGLEHLMSKVTLHYVRQHSARGLGDAIYHAKKHVGEEPFAVMLGDVIHCCQVPVVSQLAKVHEESGGSVIALEQVPWDKVGRFGIVKGESIGPRVFRIGDMVEKPRPEDAPSNLAVAGTYLLTPGVFDCIEQTAPGVNGEIQLTDALRLLAQKENVHGYEIEGTRYDVGDKVSWMQANLILTAQDPRFAGEMNGLMHDLLIATGRQERKMEDRARRTEGRDTLVDVLDQREEHQLEPKSESSMIALEAKEVKPRKRSSK
ncbi:MAG: UTP--glucose-1-phosphate uridylyltransferase GalU [Methanomassiliicoccus sp.]|nr:UTP--glucose-1-phosphate uridylyltransferase GalU [Methanomassiliicoccus sp.]